MSLLAVCPCVSSLGGPKKAYLSEDDARDDIPVIAPRMTEAEQRMLNVYQCFTGWWHIGKRGPSEADLGWHQLGDGSWSVVERAS